MKVRSLNTQQIFVYGLINSIIYELAHPGMNDGKKIHELICEANFLRMLANRLEQFKPIPEDESETVSFVNYVSEYFVETVPSLVNSFYPDQVKFYIRAYSRIILSEVLRERYNASALITELIIWKNRVLQSKWMTTDSKKKPCVEVFVSEIQAIIAKLEPQVV